jgi:hypothetical protein
VAVCTLLALTKILAVIETSFDGANMQDLPAPPNDLDELEANVFQLMRAAMTAPALLEDTCRCIASLSLANVDIAEDVLKYCETCYTNLLTCVTQLDTVCYSVLLSAALSIPSLLSAIICAVSSLIAQCNHQVRSHSDPNCNGHCSLCIHPMYTSSRNTRFKVAAASCRPAHDIPSLWTEHASTWRFCVACCDT